jgi:hypothetical protein
VEKERFKKEGSKDRIDEEMKRNVISRTEGTGKKRRCN